MKKKKPNENKELDIGKKKVNKKVEEENVEDNEETVKEEKEVVVKEKKKTKGGLKLTKRKNFG